MSNPMLAEKCESLSKSGRREHKKGERKMWKKSIKISRLPSFGFSGSDFTIDQIPVIFSGYSAESEDSFSSEVSDDSRTCSKSSDENEEVDQARSKLVRSVPSMKILRRQSTRVKKMRSMTRLTSNSRQILNKKNLDSVSRDDLGLLEPHYSRPTSSSASKNVENIQKNLGVARLKRISSLRYNGLLKATCSSAMKGSSSKKSNDVCNYRYCSLHGRPHSHTADNVSVPSLKRFVSMRRKFLKRQKSVNRRLVLLKRTLSRKRGPFVTDQDREFNQEEGSSLENDSESNGRSSETVMVDVDDNGNGGMESKPEIMDHSDGTTSKALCQEIVTGFDYDDMKVEKIEESDEEIGSSGEDGKKVENVWNEEESMDHSDGTTSKALCQEIVTGFDHDNRKVEKIEESDEDIGSSGEDGKKVENVWNEEESKPEIMDHSDDITSKDLSQETVTGFDHDDRKVQKIEESDEEIGSSGEMSLEDGRIDMESAEDNEEVCREEDGKNTERIWNGTLTVVKQAFDEILAEITDDEAGLSDSTSLDINPIQERDKLLSVIVSTSHMGEESNQRRGPKKWNYLKRVILLKRFLKSLDRKDRKEGRKFSDGEESEAMRLRRELVGERKNAEEWMLDHALKQVISTLDSSQKRKVKHLIKAFESLVPMDSGGSRVHDVLGSFETVKSQVILRDNIDLEEKKLTSEALESKEDSSSSHHLAGLDLETEEKTGDSEKINLSTWRNLIQKQMVNCDETENEHKWTYGTNLKEDGEAAERRNHAVESFQKAFESILSEIPESSFDDEKIVSESSGEIKRSWNSLRKVILLRKFVKSMEKVEVFNTRKLQNLPEMDAESVLLIHRSKLEQRRTAGEELMLDYALRQAISRLAPIQRKKVELLVQAFDSVLDGHEAPKQSKNKDETGEEGTPRLQEDSDVNKDVLKEEDEIDSTPKESRNLLTSVRNVKQQMAVEKDSRLWKLIYKHMVTEKEETNTESVALVAGETDGEAPSDLQIDVRSSTVTLVREALEKILSEIPDNSSDDQSIYSDITTDQELISFKPKSNEKKGWNNVKKVILLKRFVSDLGSMTRLSPKTPRVLPWEPDSETEKIRLRPQAIGEKRNSEEWMLDYALRQAISTLAPSQKRKVSLLAQAFDTISLQDIGSCSTPGSRNFSRQSSIENEGNAEITRRRLESLQEDFKEATKLDDLQEKQQCSSLWRLLCKQMEDNEQTEETRKEEDEEEEETTMDGEKMKLYQTEAVELLGEVIDEISLEERQKVETLQKINRWVSLKRVILLRRFVKALENVRKFNPKEAKFLPLNPEIEAEKNLRHQETQNKRNEEEWMADNALQEVVSKLTPARKLKVQLLVQAFETLSASEMNQNNVNCRVFDS